MEYHPKDISIFYTWFPLSLFRNRMALKELDFLIDFFWRSAHRREMIAERTKCLLAPRACWWHHRSKKIKIPFLFRCWCSSSLVFRPPIFILRYFNRPLYRNMIYANLCASLSSTSLSSFFTFRFFFSFLLIDVKKKCAYVTIIELRWVKKKTKKKKKKKLLKDSDNERWTFVRFNGSSSITAKYIIRMIPIIERQVRDSFAFWDMHVADLCFVTFQMHKMYR